jgi:hypothetical protein
MKKIHESKNNKKFNATINKVHAEMESAKKSVSSWNLRWRETYSDVYCYDLQFLLEDDIDFLQSRYDGMYDLSRYYDDSKREGQAIERVTLEDDNGEEYVCEFRKLDWLLTNSKTARNFSFVNTGGISYSQIKRKRTSDDQSYDYYAAYDVNNNDLSIRFVNSNEDICFINGDLRQYSFENKTIAEDEDCITLIENKDETSRLEIEIDRSGNVIRKHLMLGDYNYVMEGNDVVSAFVGDIQLDIDAELWVVVTYAIDQFEIGKISDDKVFDYVNGIKTKVINAIKGIKGDVPMEGLLRRLDVALSMISTKKIVHPEDSKELKKRK